MTSEEHNKTLATLYFIYGAMHGLTLIGLLLLVFVVKFATPSTQLLPISWIVAGTIAFVILFLFVGLLPVLVGFGFRKRRLWVKPIGLPLAVISLVNIPIGTALGIYTIKFFTSGGGVQLYGGNASVPDEERLQQALDRAQPLMNWADRLK